MTLAKGDVKVAVIGHSLAAPENRVPFQALTLPTILCAPEIWRSPGTTTLLHSSSMGNLETLRVTGFGSNSLFLYKGLESLITRHRPTLVYLWEEPWSLAAWQISRLQLKYSFQFLFFSAENKPKRLFPPFTTIANRVYRSATSAVVPTPEVAAQLKKSGFSGPIHTIPLWVSQRPFIPLTPHFRFAYIGRLIPLKRVDMLIRALALMPAVIFRIIGDGPQKRELMELARSLGLEGRVEFFGQLPNETLSQALKDVRLVALVTGENPNQSEQFGKSVLDAVLSGIPALVAPTGHLGHWPLEFETVRTTNCESPETLASDLMNALTTPPSLHSLQKAREKAQLAYGPQQAALRFDQLFLDTCN